MYHLSVAVHRLKASQLEDIAAEDTAKEKWSHNCFGHPLDRLQIKSVHGACRVFLGFENCVWPRISELASLYEDFAHLASNDVFPFNHDVLSCHTPSFNPPFGSDATLLRGRGLTRCCLRGVFLRANRRVHERSIRRPHDGSSPAHFHFHLERDNVWHQRLERREPCDCKNLVMWKTNHL